MVLYGIELNHIYA